MRANTIYRVRNSISYNMEERDCLASHKAQAEQYGQKERFP